MTLKEGLVIGFAGLCMLPSLVTFIVLCAAEVRSWRKG